jgi:hypothetical protein
MKYHTCIAAPKEMMVYRIICAECGLSTETDSDQWTPAEGAFKWPRCGATCPVASHMRAKGDFWGEERKSYWQKRKTAERK